MSLFRQYLELTDSISTLSDYRKKRAEQIKQIKARKKQGSINIPSKNEMRFNSEETELYAVKEFTLENKAYIQYIHLDWGGSPKINERGLQLTTHFAIYNTKIFWYDNNVTNEGIPITVLNKIIEHIWEFITLAKKRLPETKLHSIVGKNPKIEYIKIAAKKENTKRNSNQRTKVYEFFFKKLMKRMNIDYVLVNATESEEEYIQTFKLKTPILVK